MSLKEEDMDLILLQEHGLWKFEADTLEELFPGYDYTVQCADEDDPLPNDVRLRGRAGVAILWKKSLSHLAASHPDGSERINVVTLKCSPQPICLINVYMPPQGTPDFKLNFGSHLDQIHEIVQKFRDHIIILGGDLNGSISSPKYPHDHQLQATLKDLKLELPQNYPSANTFFSHNGSTRHLDYILCSHPDLLNVKDPLHIAANTSAHCPVPANA